MINWRKSSYSGGGSDEACIEVAALVVEVGVRDSKDPEGGRLVLRRAGFAGLVAQVKSEELGR